MLEKLTTFHTEVRWLFIKSLDTHLFIIVWILLSWIQQLFKPVETIVFKFILKVGDFFLIKIKCFSVSFSFFALFFLNCTSLIACWFSSIVERKKADKLISNINSVCVFFVNSVIRLWNWIRFFAEKLSQSQITAWLGQTGIFLDRNARLCSPFLLHVSGCAQHSSHSLEMLTAQFSGMCPLGWRRILLITCIILMVRKSILKTRETGLKQNYRVKLSKSAPLRFKTDALVSILLLWNRKEAPFWMDLPFSGKLHLSLNGFRAAVWIRPIRAWRCSSWPLDNRMCQRFCSDPSPRTRKPPCRFYQRLCWKKLCVHSNLSCVKHNEPQTLKCLAKPFNFLCQEHDCS